MQIPCTIKALKYVTYGENLEMREGEYAEVTLVSDSPANRYRMLEVTTQKSSTFFTEAALENAIKRGDFEVC